MSCFVHADPGPMHALIICEFGFPALVTHSIFNLEERLDNVHINLLNQSKNGYRFHNIESLFVCQTSVQNVQYK